MAGVVSTDVALVDVGLAGVLPVVVVAELVLMLDAGGVWGAR
jgi:hypothetical protein